MSFKDLALPLAAKGIPVIPVNPLAKDCYLPGGEERGTLDPVQIARWDQENPDYNVGCLGTAEGITVFDCDVQGLMSRIVKDTGKTPPPTFTVKSAGKGCAHYYYKQTAVSRALGNKKGDGLFDLRGKNHYVVGPGSKLRLPDGAIKGYKIWNDAPIADFPDWLGEWILANSSSKKGTNTGEVDTDSYARLRKSYLQNLNPADMFGLPDLTIGSLHPTLHSLACLLHNGERSEEDTVEILGQIADAYGHRSARDPAELEGLVAHAFKKDPANLTLPEGHPALTPPPFTWGLQTFATGALLDVHRDKSWRALFHTKAYLESRPPVKFAINGFLQEEGITMLGGLPGHGKTLVALAMVRALLEGTPLFGIFEVPRLSDRVIYLIPESGPSPWAARLRTFRIMDYNDDRLFTRTFSIQDDGPVPLTDPRILEACKGADVFLDTAVRFMEGDENSASEQKVFARNLFALLGAGARTVTGLHHSPKGTEKLDYMSLENMLRGSGDLGAMLSTCWGLSQVDASRNHIYVQNVKAREFEACAAFIIEGRPQLDVDGYFKLVAPPGTAGSLNENKPRREGERKSGRPEHPEKTQKMTRIRELHAAGKTSREIAATVGLSFRTVCRWLGDDDRNAVTVE